ncbi:hypothetical protein [Parendozoicomonas sp. Alg238-R29]|uniref:hypothetical protein n=1 Tax=Parendozoicomonas sp. Alg238-R29 TaxID=2993446 RepID=UPI00248D7808|nr:hypothetical protein [Parendozoicomonas sp. Alg238-R29]
MVGSECVVAVNSSKISVKPSVRLPMLVMKKGYEVYTPALRHHQPDNQDMQALGTASIRDDVDDLTALP